LKDGLKEGLKKKVFDAQVSFDGSELLGKSACLFFTPCLVGGTNDPMPVIFHRGGAQQAPRKHMGLTLSETKTNGKHFVDHFDHKAVFRDAEGLDCLMMGLPIDGGEGSWGPEILSLEATLQGAFKAS
jgi:hypothetical protein